MTGTGWWVGQEALMDGREVVKIERVTPGGRAVVGERNFLADGREVGGRFNRPKLVPWTPELKADMELTERGRQASGELYKALSDIDKWVRKSLTHWGNQQIPDRADVENGERLVAILKQWDKAEGNP